MSDVLCVACYVVAPQMSEYDEVLASLRAKNKEEAEVTAQLTDRRSQVGGRWGILCMLHFAGDLSLSRTGMGQCTSSAHNPCCWLPGVAQQHE
jgi:hypothetical protein